ncbi:MAG: hypothetical protein V3W08_07845, partial [Candidatus Binatia bacterium]
GNYVRSPGKSFGCFRDFLIIKGADVAESLGQDEIRVGFFETRKINGVKALFGFEVSGDDFVDRAAINMVRVNSALYHNLSLLCFRGIVAFVGNTHNGITQSQGKSDLRGARQQ